MTMGIDKLHRCGLGNVVLRKQSAFQRPHNALGKDSLDFSGRVWQEGLEEVGNFQEVTS